ncbi:hypothetical protein HY571_02250 [Candidatus Micrarchaeota archaeon]|nr:hypothetical protein [Candidatus Micrarchaeota archaeon]
MGLFESIVLTIAIIVVDVLIIKEYLRLEDELNRLKNIKTVPADLQTMEQEVNEELPEAEPQPTAEQIENLEVNREVQQLKAIREVEVDMKKQRHEAELDSISEKLDSVLENLKQTRSKVAG